jgi:hypothetical protein
MCRSRPKCRDPTKLSRFKELQVGTASGERRRIQFAVDCRPFYESEMGTIAAQSSKLSATKMTNAANFFAAFEACLPAAYEVSCRIRTGSPTSFWLDSPRTVASRHSIGSPVPRRRGLGRQAATRRRHRGVYEFREGCQSSATVGRCMHMANRDNARRREACKG